MSSNGRLVKVCEDLRLPIKPMTKDKYVGIEIEFLSSVNFTDLAKMLMAERLTDYVSLKGDGSVDYDEGTCDCHPGQFYFHGEQSFDDDCDCGSCGHTDLFSHELCVLVKQSEVTKIMNKVGKVLKRAKAFTNDTCGLHVHVDVRNRDKFKAFSNLVAAQDALYSLAKAERKTNTFCRPLPKDAQFIDLYADRYMGINKQSVQKFGTLEVRLYHGTVNPTEISRWSKLLINLTDRKQTTLLDIKELRKVVKTKELKAFINSSLRKRRQEAKVA